MKLTPEELPSQGYQLIEEMDHKELMPFVKLYIRKRTISSFIYYGSMVLSFVVLLILCIQFHYTERIPFHKGLSHVSRGGLICLALIPIHEVIHAIAYRLQGARQTSFDVNLKKIYFLAIADKFVANKKEFQLVALAPFLTITFALIVLAFTLNDGWKISMLSTVFLHSSMCVGDFALLSYFEFHKNKEIVTYDDKETKRSFFYEKGNSINV